MLCCNVLQCVVVYCSVLQCVAVCCSVLQCVLLKGEVCLQREAAPEMRMNACIAANSCCSVLQRVAAYCLSVAVCCLSVAVCCCSVLPICCSVLPICCSVLHSAATLLSTHFPFSFPGSEARGRTSCSVQQLALQSVVAVCNN